jgi:non-ribosomal peptide synthetase-like protein
MIGFTFAALTASSCVAFISSLPALAALWVWLQAFQRGWLWTAIWVTAALTPVFVALTCLWIAMLKAILLRRAKPGVYPLYSFYHLRHWLASGLMRASRTLLLPIFSTLYLPPWLRLLGAKIGPRTEIASIWSLAEPELLTAGEGCFFADGCILGGQRTYGGRFEIRPVSVGSRSFVGNSAMLPGGASLGDNCLVGVLSVPPPGTERTPDGSEWLGSPGFRLPKRLKVEVFDEGVTFRPGRKLYAQRALIDACRILIPAYAAFAIGVSGLAATLYSYEVYGLKITFALLPALGLLAAAVGVAIVVALKWAVMGRYRPVVVPLWSRYVWFNEMITGVYESIMAPVVAGFFGTPFAAPLLRLLGCKIGRDCYIGTSLVSEFDLVDIGNYVALNIGATIQNHLFEDRIMKSSYLRIGDGCSVANMAVVLYDSKMEDGSVLGPLSLLMKGEAMPARSRRHGIPTVQG